MAKKVTNPRKIYDAKFKAEVALMALNQLHTAEAVAKHFGINKTQVNLWRNIARDNMASLFSKGKHEIYDDSKEEIARMKTLIGELTIENAVLKKKSH